MGRPLRKGMSVPEKLQKNQAGGILYAVQAKKLKRNDSGEYFFGPGIIKG